MLNGAKSYVSNGPHADLFLVYATMDPRSGFLGVTPFLVERGSPGLTVGRPYEKLGLKGSPACAIYLDNCIVPDSTRLGREGGGAQIFQDSMLWERNCLFAVYVGMLSKQLGLAIEHAKTRRQGKKPIGKNQAVSHRVAEMKVRLDAARLLLYKAAWHADRGMPSAVCTAVAKLYISEAAHSSSMDCVQIHGAVGIDQDSDPARTLLDSLPATIFSGTSEIQRELIARGLGL